MQAVDLSWDPHQQDWFNVYGEEDRAAESGVIGPAGA